MNIGVTVGGIGEVLVPLMSLCRGECRRISSNMQIMSVVVSSLAFAEIFPS